MSKPRLSYGERRWIPTFSGAPLSESLMMLGCAYLAIGQKDRTRSIGQFTVAEGTEMLDYSDRRTDWYVPNVHDVHKCTFKYATTLARMRTEAKAVAAELQRWVKALREYLFFDLWWAICMVGTLFCDPNLWRFDCCLKSLLFSIIAGSASLSYQLCVKFVSS